MTGRAKLTLVLSAAISLVVAGRAALASDEPTRPSLFELVRGLKSTQNGLAFGDQAAMKASAEQADAIADWLDHATPDDWQDRRNVRALAVHLLGGGGIGSGRQSLAAAKLDEGDRELVEGALVYATGNVAGSAEKLKKFDPLKLEPILGAHVAMAQATQLVDADPALASELLAESALLAPGTLIEEASLRRRVIIAATRGSPDSFSHAIATYTRRFDNSVYRPALVATIQKVLAGRDIGSREEMEAVTAALSWMTDAEQSQILLHLAEGSIRLGRLDLALKTAGRAVAVAPDNSQERARAELYRIVSHVFLDRLGDDKRAFEGVERQKLPADDEMLLEVAEQVAQAVTATTGVEALNGAGSGGETPAIVTKARAMLAEADMQLGRR